LDVPDGFDGPDGSEGQLKARKVEESDKPKELK